MLAAMRRWYGLLVKQNSAWWRRNQYGFDSSSNLRPGLKLRGGKPYIRQCRKTLGARALRAHWPPEGAKATHPK